MLTANLLLKQEFEPDFSFSIKNWTQTKCAVVKRVLDKHTDVISNLGILAITTCLLASKIFKQTPNFLPRLAMVVFNYGGIIWLNVQVRDLLKSGRDLSRAIKACELGGIVETAAKVFVKGVNAILTCVIFGGSIVSAFVFPQASDIRDYFANEVLLQRLEKLEADPEGSLLIGKVMVCFLKIVKNVPPSSKEFFKCKREWQLADALVRQLDNYTLETFQESLSKDRKEKNPLVDALKLFYGVKDGMRNNQATTKANLSLTALGYISMGICRAFPDTLVEWLTRWSMSVLYTDAFIQRKFFQSDLADRLN